MKKSQKVAGGSAAFLGLIFAAAMNGGSEPVDVDVALTVTPTAVIWEAVTPEIEVGPVISEGITEDVSNTEEVTNTGEEDRTETIIVDSPATETITPTPTPEKVENSVTPAETIEPEITPPVKEVSVSPSSTPTLTPVPNTPTLTPTPTMKPSTPTNTPTPTSKPNTPTATATPTPKPNSPTPTFTPTPIPKRECLYGTDLEIVECVTVKNERGWDISVFRCSDGKLYYGSLYDDTVSKWVPHEYMKDSRQAKEVEKELWKLVQDYRVANGLPRFADPYDYNIEHYYENGDSSAGRMEWGATNDAKNNAKTGKADHPNADLGVTFQGAGYTQYSKPALIAMDLFTEWKNSPIHNAGMLEKATGEDVAVGLLRVYSYNTEYGTNYAAVISRTTVWSGVRK